MTTNTQNAPFNRQGEIAMLDEFSPVERVDAQFKAGTQFITRSGKLSIERVRPGATVICGDGKHRTVVWSKRVPSVAHIVQDAPLREVQNNIVAMPKTRFPKFGYAKPRDTSPTTGAACVMYWLVLSEAHEPLQSQKPKTPRYEKGMPEARWTLLDRLEEEVRGEAEIINIFAAKQRLRPSHL